MLQILPLQIMCAISYLKYVCYLFLFKSIKVSLSDGAAYLAPPDISSSPPSPLQSWRRISFPEPVVVCELPWSRWIMGCMLGDQSVTFLIGWVQPCALCQADEPPGRPDNYHHYTTVIRKHATYTFSFSFELSRHPWKSSSQSLTGLAVISTSPSSE